MTYISSNDSSLQNETSGLSFNSAVTRNKFDLSDLRVMVVENNTHTAFILGEVLRSLGVRQVENVQNGAMALREIHDISPDLILTEWAMKPVDGAELVSTIRRFDEHRNPFVPIIMVTSYTERQHVLAARDVGVNEFLAKPISATSLYSRIVRLIERPRAFVRADTYNGPDRRHRQMACDESRRNGDALQNNDNIYSGYRMAS